MGARKPRPLDPAAVRYGPDGLVAAVSGGVDGGFASVHLVACGAQGFDVLSKGGKDAFHLNQALERMGFRGNRLKALIDPLDPSRLAHRLDPKRTWLFYARSDMVFNLASSEALAEAIGLPEDHFVKVDGNHYTMFLVMPGVVHEMNQNMTRVEAEIRDRREGQATRDE